ncbi:helix-turn-helix transcriptional regulator [Streptomyces sp. PTY087I2]|uniref:helix-turn-helix transcriptional regulator n=1 Tax=Streptomyces sp. PTY087I2 TaxID=1819298 RepID=UPI00080BB526|nr:helix-turn-helix transcriptional regulator [Streptomyces sp. PTY087I2]OCC11508.1 transcriptional repressor DicA [Streptomyces sp. PTY087I2]
MPPRQFDGSRVRAVRRQRDMHQKELGKMVGVSGPTIARWESGQDFPKGEKLPVIASALRQPLDELFPHEGPPDLQLLRCDAGLSVAEAAAIIRTSRAPVSNAESGRRRLNDNYVRPLAAAYGVTEDELLSAQDRSFGIRPTSLRDDQETAPRTIGEKINFLLQYGPTGQKTLSDAEIARLVNHYAPAAVVTTEDIVHLREGTATEASDEVRDGLAHAFQVPPWLFGDDAELTPLVREFLEAIRFIGSIHQGQVLGLAARGNSEGLTVEMMAGINRLVGELRHKLPEVQDEE